jgi:hypothetical protein
MKPITKILFAWALCLCALQSPAQLGKKITDLPALVGTPLPTDVLPIVNNGITKQATVAQVCAADTAFHTGPTGPTGATGATGANGTPGANGNNGLDGANGLDGVTGPTGATGANGATGPTGPTGAAGSNGAAGATGPTGDTNGWLLTGNGGTNATTNYIGTTDNTDFKIGANGTKYVTLTADGQFVYDRGNSSTGRVTWQTNRQGLYATYQCISCGFEKFLYADTTAAAIGISATDGSQSHYIKFDEPDSGLVISGIIGSTPYRYRLPIGSPAPGDGLFADANGNFQFGAGGGGGTTNWGDLLTGGDTHVNELLYLSPTGRLYSDAGLTRDSATGATLISASFNGQYGSASISAGQFGFVASSFETSATSNINGDSAQLFLQWSNGIDTNYYLRIGRTIGGTTTMGADGFVFKSADGTYTRLPDNLFGTAGYTLATDGNGQSEWQPLFQNFKVEPADGDTVVINTNRHSLTLVKPAAALDTLYIEIPGAGIIPNGQIAGFSFTEAVTTIIWLVTPGGNVHTTVPSTITAGGTIKIKYVETDDTWYNCP